MCLLSVLAVVLAVASTRAQDNVVRLLTHDSFNVSEQVLADFERESGLTVEIVRLGDAGLLVNQAILTRENPLGDVLYGIDNTFLSRAFDADLFSPYRSSALDLSDSPYVDPSDTQARVTPIDYGDVCLNYDVAYFAERDLALPETLIDLTTPEYAGLLVVQNPATSSPGLAFLLATIAVFGELDDYTYLDYWRDLVANDVLIADDWTDAYYGQFSGSAGSTGDRPLVISYASSPPVEVYFADPPLARGEPAPTGAIVTADTCFRQIEYAGVLVNAANPVGAEKLIDFLLSESFQEDIPLQMFVYPIHPDADLPDVFLDYSTAPEQPVTLDSAVIDAGRDGWIAAWTDAILR